MSYIFLYYYSWEMYWFFWVSWALRVESYCYRENILADKLDGSFVFVKGGLGDFASF